MREIKFRFWNAEDKIMIDGDSLAFEEYLPITMHLSQEGIMQWTGLTDRNGKAVYEGDICEGEHATYLIQWNAEKSQYQAKIIKTNSVLSKHCSFPLWQYVEDDGKYRFEVIGNQFDNPELINS